MKTRAVKYIFFIIIIILIIIAVFIIYKDSNESIAKVQNKKLDNIVSSNITIGLAEFDTINPHESQNQDVQYITKLIFKDLIGVNKEFELEPSLAKEWSKIAPKIYLIKLKEDEYWHNGEKFTAKDVEFTINVLKDETSNSVFKENVKNIEKIEIIDEYTIKIYTYEEQEFFEYNLSFPILSSNSFKNIPIGTGNYEVTEISNEYIILKEKDCVGIPQKIRINLYTDYSELYSAFSQEKVDIITTSNVEFNNYVGTIDLKENKIEGRNLNYLRINKEDETLKDSNIRNAISFAINKEQLIYNVFNNKYFFADNPINSSNYLMQANNESNYDLNNARENIISSNWKYQNNNWVKNGRILEVELSVKGNNKIQLKLAQEIKTQLEEIGIKIEIIELSEEAYNNRLENTQYEMILCTDTLPIYPNIGKYLDTDNEEAKRLLEQIKDIQNKDVLKETYSNILEICKKEKSVICLTFDSIVILHNSNVKGDFTGNWYNIFYNIGTWYKEL